MKNNVADAAVKQQGGLEPACAAAGEFDVYKFNCDYLRGCGVAIGDYKEDSFLGIECQIPPAVSLAPSVYLGHGKVMGGSLAAGSTLVLEGDVTLENVSVDGCLVVKAAPGQAVVLKDLAVKNKGWTFEALSEAELAVRAPRRPARRPAR